MPSDPIALLHRELFPALWLAWLGYWLWSAVDVKATERRESAASRWAHLGPLVIAGALLGSPRLGLPALDARFLPRSEAVFWIGAAITAAGLAFAVWARRHIGRNWSASVTVKAGHELVTSGPYALVRHPIYTGLLLGFTGWAIATGQWRGVLAVLVAYLSLLRKYRLEERWMRERFGPAYDDYARRVKALVPFVI